QIVRDARELGVEVRPVDVNHSDWDCTLEPLCENPSPPCRAEREGEGGVGNRSGIPHLTPTLSAPHWAMAGGEGAHGSRWALRLGLRQIKGLSEADAERLVRARGAGYRDARDLWHRSGLGHAALERLAAADALRSLCQSNGGLDRRRGLWALKA